MTASTRGAAPPQQVLPSTRAEQPATSTSPRAVDGAVPTSPGGPSVPAWRNPALLAGLRRGAAWQVAERSPPADHDGPPPMATSRLLPLLASGASLLGLALLTLVVQVAALSAVEHARSQRIAYAELRADLSSVTAPTGQQDADGRLLALGTPVALFTAPDLGLQREVVFEGTTSGVLARGPGHRRSSVLPGQAGTAILYGRAWAYGGPFRGAQDLRPGSVITVTTGQGEHTYAVTGIRRAGAVVPPPPDVAAGKGRLTLVTADGPPFAPNSAVYVDADLTSPAVPAPPRVLTAAQLLPAEEALAGDRSKLPIILVLLQGLAVASLAMAWASRRWGTAPAWLVGTPVVTVFALLAAREISLLLPNLL